jgi:hypothetical protein
MAVTEPPTPGNTTTDARPGSGPPSGITTDLFAGALLFLGIFGTYLRLLAPGIALEDSGEFATAALTLSLTHPPGYPLYILAGRLFSLLPVGSPAFRLGLMSAASAGLAAAFLYGFIRKLVSGPSILAALPAVAFACAPALALQAVMPDKYAFNCALVCAAMLAALTAFRKEGSRLGPLALLAGLALAHHMQVLYLAFAAAGLLWRERVRIPVRTAVLLVLLAMPGLSLKPVALPLLSRANPSLMYGELSTAPLTRRYLSAYDYSGRFKAFTPAKKAERLWKEGFAGLWRQAGPVVLALAVPGIVLLWRGSAPVLIAGGAGTLFALALIANFDIAGTGYYLLPVVAFLCARAGAGLALLRARLGQAVALTAGLLAAGWPAWHGLPPADFSRYHGAVDWARDLLASLPPGSVLVTQHDDDFFPPMYVQRVLGEGAGIVLVHRPFMTRLWYHAQAERMYPGFRLLDPALIPWGTTVEPEVLVNLFLRSHYGRKPVASEARGASMASFAGPAGLALPTLVAFTYIANAETAGGFSLTPTNCVYIVGRRDDKQRLPRSADFAARIRRFRLRTAFGPYPDGPRIREVAGAWAALWTQLAVRWWDRGDPAEARACLQKALEYPNTRVVKADLERLKETIGGL